MTIRLIQIVLDDESTWQTTKCKSCNKDIVISNRLVESNHTSIPIKCPYCHEDLWEELEVEE